MSTGTDNLSAKASSQEGFTLIELLISVFILLIGIVSALSFYITSLTATEFAKDITTATHHAESIFEEMRSRDTLAEITVEDWPVWANANNFNTLPQEAIAVDYLAGPLADPLRTQVTVTWVRKNRTGKVSYTTEFTKW
ncbi:MAG: prepilin-type N-terminal cleavage/methylation domain-containing protein [Candidatus Omnitrophota bacterium]|nr:prepilin-type N-terminal cleavage/methylation domain-containing protein [Candidatus Omnitrophota bacterium]